MKIVIQDILYWLKNFIKILYEKLKKIGLN